MSKPDSRRAKSAAANNSAAGNIRNTVVRGSGLAGSGVRDADLRGEQGMFSDPRKRADRRKRGSAGSISVIRCRRRAERRTAGYMHQEEWWIRRTYSKAE